MAHLSTSIVEPGPAKTKPPRLSIDWVDVTAAAGALLIVAGAFVVHLAAGLVTLGAFMLGVASLHAWRASRPPQE
jgi:hypothetical protein